MTSSYKVDDLVIPDPSNPDILDVRQVLDHMAHNLSGA